MQKYNFVLLLKKEFIADFRIFNKKKTSDIFRKL